MRERQISAWKGTLCSFWLLASNARVSHLHQMSHPQRHPALCWEWFMGNAVVRPQEHSARTKHSLTLNGTVYMMNTPDNHSDTQQWSLKLLRYKANYDLNWRIRRYQRCCRLQFNVTQLLKALQVKLCDFCNAVFVIVTLRKQGCYTVLWDGNALANTLPLPLACLY